jgi:ArsR family transcriptional regulator
LHYLDQPALVVAEAARLLRPAGRLLIVDFAPHGHEFLREKDAHVRLGFSDRQMREWFAEAGLEQVESRDFAPVGDDAGLTVKLWLARDRRLLIADPAEGTRLGVTV